MTNQSVWVRFVERAQAEEKLREVLGESWELEGYETMSGVWTVKLRLTAPRSDSKVGRMLHCGTRHLGFTLIGMPDRSVRRAGDPHRHQYVLWAGCTGDKSHHYQRLRSERARHGLYVFDDCFESILSELLSECGLAQGCDKEVAP